LQSCHDSSSSNIISGGGVTSSRSKDSDKRYQNCRRGILLLCLLIASRVFAREGEDVLVACSRQEKDVAVDCLFWQILSR